MLKFISFIGMLAATPLAAQNCALLCDAENWMAGDPQFILDAIAAGEDVNATPEGASPPLVKAIMIGLVDTVQPLLDAGANPNITDSYGTTALLAASNAPDTGIIPLLIAAGADVNAANARGETALHFAAAGIITPQYLPLLLNAGADVNAVDAEGNTALHMLAKISTMTGAPYLIAANAAILLNAGVGLNVQNNEGQTALHIAATDRTPLLVSQLLAAGADGSLRDTKGRTAFMLAAELMHFNKFPQVWAALEAAQ